MKILYVSDLDGTLLNKNQEMDFQVAQELNKMIDNGVNFTISTGRGDSVRSILKEVKFKLPVMALNGSVNYDFARNEYMDKKVIPNDKVLEIIHAFERL